MTSIYQYISSEVDFALHFNWPTHFLLFFSQKMYTLHEFHIWLISRDWNTILTIKYPPMKSVSSDMSIKIKLSSFSILQMLRYNPDLILKELYKASSKEIESILTVYTVYLTLIKYTHTIIVF